MKDLPCSDLVLSLVTERPPLPKVAHKVTSDVATVIISFETKPISGTPINGIPSPIRVTKNNQLKSLNMLDVAYYASPQSDITFN